jgi:protein gp37
MDPQWAREIRDQCMEYEVPFFFKQWGKHLPEDQYSDDTLDGKQWLEFPL